MGSGEFDDDEVGPLDNRSEVHCPDCQSVLWGDGNQEIAFLLVDQLTIPVLSCETHLEQFTSICGFTTAETASLLQYRPAGGVQCPSCRLAPYNAAKPLIPIQDGAIAPVACAEHQTEIIERYHTGLETQQQLQQDIHTNAHL